MTDDLILRLSHNLRPVSPVSVTRRLALGLGCGALASAILAWLTLGYRPDMMAAAGESMFWIKLAYALALAGVGLWACERLARPAGDPRRRLIWLVLPLFAVAILAGWQVARAPAPMRPHLIMGDTAMVCPWRILTFSLAPLAGLVWAIRGLAPTRLRLTGLMVGIAAGGVGAAVYALHCPEPKAPFLAVWYTLGVACAGGLGTVTAPRVLRW